MEFKDLLASFVLIFLAELGDKTQLSVFTFSLKSRTSGFPWDVLIGACVALVVSTILATILGYAGKSFIPERMTSVVHYVAAAGFIGIGVWMFVSKS
jgi:Ca2+/H+ antiporter, TMEM165/GDT1 family